MNRQTAHEIDQEAADWAAKVDRGLSTAEQRELDRWLYGDTRRIGAYGRMRAIALQTERVAALGPVHSPHQFDRAEHAGLSRRRLLASGASIAASLLAVGATGWFWSERGKYQTRKGEVRQVAMEDGSVVTLNTATELAVQLHADRREVKMTQGEALFDVARDPVRPFVVVAGTTQVRVLGTSFIVRALPDKPLQVLVREGTVEVSRSDLAAAPERLSANMRAVSYGSTHAGPAAMVVTNVPPASMDRALAWRENQIDFEGETLEQAVTEFARYSDTRIIVDPDLKREEIAGVYQTNDPVGFARAVAGSLRAQVNIADGEIRIRKALS